MGKLGVIQILLNLIYIDGGWGSFLLEQLNF